MPASPAVRHPSVLSHRALEALHSTSTRCAGSRSQASGRAESHMATSVELERARLVLARLVLARRRPSSTRALSHRLLCLLCLSLACCAAPLPKPAEMLTVGFRSPRQAFETFRIASRAGLRELEYRCWSGDFKERNGLGALTYREVRDQMMAEQGLIGRAVLARAIWKAEVDELTYLGPGRVRLRARYAGHTLNIDLVREDFWEFWEGDQRLADGDEYAFEALTSTVEDEAGNLLFQGLAPLDAPDYGDRISELRIGQEWKLDGFGVDDDS